MTEIVCAHSPDSDDAFMFYAMSTGLVRSDLVSVRHQLQDIESLNRKALEGEHELTAISYHAYPYVADKYVLMASGSSIGDDYGPMLISVNPYSAEEVRGKRIAIPGTMTTAYLTLKLYQPDFEAVVTPFNEIPRAVRSGAADIGLIIHEAQLTYSRGGFHLIEDLGKWWKREKGLPLPLGANALLRSLPDDVKSECCRLMRESIAYALAHRKEALNYALQFARDMDPATADQFVGMYVNHHTVDCGDDMPKAAQLLLDLGYEAGIVRNRIQVEFVR
jgi:1,4-dihydroxy-6-naphthoate synthase